MFYTIYNFRLENRVVNDYRLKGRQKKKRVHKRFTTTQQPMGHGEYGHKKSTFVVCSLRLYRIGYRFVIFFFFMGG